MSFGERFRHEFEQEGNFVLVRVKGPQGVTIQKEDVDVQIQKRRLTVIVCKETVLEGLLQGQVDVALSKFKIHPDHVEIKLRKVNPAEEDWPRLMMRQSVLFPPPSVTKKFNAHDNISANDSNIIAASAQEGGKAAEIMGIEKELQGTHAGDYEWVEEEETEEIEEEILEEEILEEEVEILEEEEEEIQEEIIEEEIIEGPQPALVEQTKAMETDGEISRAKESAPLDGQPDQGAENVFSFCMACGIDEEFVPDRMIMCPHCGSKNPYCSKDCLEWDWTRGGHKQVCRGSTTAKPRETHSEKTPKQSEDDGSIEAFDPINQEQVPGSKGGVLAALKKSKAEVTNKPALKRLKCQACDMDSEFVPDGMLPCESCQKVHYCSNDCLQWHWRHGGHAKACEGNRRAAAASIDDQVPHESDLSSIDPFEGKPDQAPQSQGGVLAALKKSKAQAATKARQRLQELEAKQLEITEKEKSEKERPEERKHLNAEVINQSVPKELEINFRPSNFDTNAIPSEVRLGYEGFAVAVRLQCLDYDEDMPFDETHEDGKNEDEETKALKRQIVELQSKLRQKQIIRKAQIQKTERHTEELKQHSTESHGAPEKVRENDIEAGKDLVEQTGSQQYVAPENSLVEELPGIESIAKIVPCDLDGMTKLVAKYQERLQTLREERQKLTIMDTSPSEEHEGEKSSYGELVRSTQKALEKLKLAAISCKNGVPLVTMKIPAEGMKSTRVRKQELLSSIHQVDWAMLQAKKRLEKIKARDEAKNRETPLQFEESREAIKGSQEHFQRIRELSVATPRAKSVKIPKARPAVFYSNVSRPRDEAKNRGILFQFEESHEAIEGSKEYVQRIRELSVAKPSAKPPKMPQGRPAAQYTSTSKASKILKKIKAKQKGMRTKLEH